MCEYMVTGRTRLRLYPDLGTYDKETVHSIIDDAPICHVSMVIDGAPYLQATAHWRDGEKLYVHGAVKNKMVNAVRKGAEACIAFTHFDGYILPRSGFNHAVLYRSAVVFSKGRFVEDLEEKRGLLDKFIDGIEPGRSETVRPPTVEELKQTGVVEFELKEVSAKSIPMELSPALMPGGEMEAPEDVDYHPWTGVIPYTLTRGDAMDAEGLKALAD